MNTQKLTGAPSGNAQLRKALRQSAPALIGKVPSCNICSTTNVVSNINAVGSRSSKRSKQHVLCAAAPAATQALPWQLSEIKKRTDLKTIMIIGAGPIVIGQVRHERWPPAVFYSRT